MNCSYCRLKEIKAKVKNEGHRIILRPSNFMNGIDVFELKRGEIMPNEYLQPCKDFPKGDIWYQTHYLVWFGEVSDKCMYYDKRKIHIIRKY